MEVRSTKRECSHRFIDQYSGKCLHCGYTALSITVLPKTKIDCDLSDQYELLEQEHHERLVQILDHWKTNSINRIESIYKAKLDHLRYNHERQQLVKRRACQAVANEKQLTENNEKEDIRKNLSATKFHLVHSFNLDTQYTCMAASTDNILVHDGRVFKLFSKDLQPLVALDIQQVSRERLKLVDMCYVNYLSSYLILFEQSVWTFEPGSNAIAIPSMKRQGYVSLATNNKDLFVLDRDGTIEQRSLVSWIFLRRYSRQHLLNDHLTDNILSIRFHSTDMNKMMAVVRMGNNRRCIMLYQHYGSNTFKFLDRVVFPNINIYSSSPLRISNVWLLTTCEKKVFIFLSHKHEYDQRQHQQIHFSLDCDYRMKSAIGFQTEPRSVLVRTIRPSQLRHYQF